MLQAGEDVGAVGALRIGVSGLGEQGAVGSEEAAGEGGGAKVEGQVDNVDRFVTTVLIPERARTLPPRDQPAAASEFQREWDQVKEAWK